MVKNNLSFTLIELLVVLALVAILSVVVVLTLNPTELLKQARDSNRLSDLATINTALNLFSTDVASGFMGTSTVVYVSIPSASPTCVGLGLPTLPTGYTYNCATTQNLRNTDGTGWIPVNFQRISSNSPISQLPIDPINTTSTRLYYTYVPGGSWELNASIEAVKNKLGGSNDLTSKDGGNAVSTYEIGNNLNLSPLETGDSSLVGYWSFEEGPSSTSTDRSGYGNHGIWYGTSTAQQHYVAGKVGSYAGSFNGSGDYVPTMNSLPINGTGPRTVSFWVNISSGGLPIMYYGFGSGSLLFFIGTDSSRRVYFAGYSNDITGVSSLGIGTWSHVAVVYGGSTSLDIYVNGLLDKAGTLSSTLNTTASSLSVGRYLLSGGWGNGYFRGLIDEARVYSRAFSAAEVLALYNSTK